MIDHWETHAEGLLAASDDDEKAEAACRLGQTSLEGNPDATRFIRTYLKSSWREELQHPTLAFLLRGLIKKPRRDEVAIASEYWNPSRVDTISEATAVIKSGLPLYTEEERMKYVDRAKEYYVALVRTPAPYNAQTDLVEVVGEFEGSPSLEWMCDVVKTTTAGAPNNSTAFDYAREFNPKRAAEAMFSNLVEFSRGDVGSKGIAICYLAELHDFLNQDQIKVAYEKAKQIIAIGSKLTGLQRDLDNYMYQKYAKDLPPVLSVLEQAINS